MTGTGVETGGEAVATGKAMIRRERHAPPGGWPCAAHWGSGAVKIVEEVREDRPVKRRYTGPGAPHCYCPDPGALPAIIEIPKRVRE